MMTFLLILVSSALAAGGMYLSLREQVKACEADKQGLIDLLMETRDLLDDCEDRLVSSKKPEPKALDLKGEPVPLKLVVKHAIG